MRTERLTEQEAAVLAGVLDRRIRRRDVPASCAFLRAPFHQVRGTPRSAPGFSAGPCCGKQPRFLAAVGDSCSDPRGFTGNEFVGLNAYQCDECRLLRVVQAGEG